MTNYGLGNNVNYIPHVYKKSIMSANDNLAKYAIKYTGKTKAQMIYDNLIKFLPQGSHLGNYNEVK